VGNRSPFAARGGRNQAGDPERLEPTRVPIPPFSRRGDGSELTFVAIDGLARAGKTSMARAPWHAADQQRVTLVTVDEVYEPETRETRTWTPREGYERYFDHVRLEQALLQPLRQGVTARNATFDRGQRASGRAQSVAPEGVVVVDGVYLLKPRRPAPSPLLGRRDLGRHASGCARATLTRPLNSRRGWIERWMRAEDHYVLSDQPDRAATFVVPGE